MILSWHANLARQTAECLDIKVLWAPLRIDAGAGEQRLAANGLQ